MSIDWGSFFAGVAYALIAIVFYEIGRAAGARLSKRVIATIERIWP